MKQSERAAEGAGVSEGSVAFFHSTRARGGGDGGFYATALGSSLWRRYLRHFDDVVVAIPTESGPVQGMPRIEGRGVEVRPLRFGGGLAKAISTRRLKDEVREIIRGVDAVVARVPSNVGFVACQEARRQEKPYAVEVVGCGWDAYWHHSVSGKLLAPLNFILMRSAVRHATSALYVTDKFLQKRYPTKAPAWVASNAEVIPPNADELRSRIEDFDQVSSRPLRLATVGAVDVRYKGQETVIKALAALRSRGINAEYHVVGGGSQAQLAKAAEKAGVVDAVIFHGLLAHSEVLDQLRSTDIYVQPSFTEGQPRAVVEAMSVSTPVIGSDAGGTPENLPATQVFHRGDVQSLVACVESTLATGLPEAAKWSAKRAQHFEPARISAARDGYLSHLKGAVGEHR